MNGFYWVYFLLFSLTLIYAATQTSEKKMMLYSIACSVLIFFFIARDASVSIDTPEYMRQYAMIPSLTLKEMLHHKFEIGYNLLCKLLALLFESDRVLFVAMGLLTMVPFFIWFQRECVEPMIALMCFLALGMYIHAVIFSRQLCAMAIMTFAWRFVRERKPIPFLLLLLLAMSFHKSAAVLAVIYVAYLLPVNKWLLYIAAISSAVMYVLGKQIAIFVATYIYHYESRYFVADGGVTMLIVLWIFVFLTYWILRDRMKEENIKLLFIMVLIAAVIQPVVFVFYNWCRVVLYFRVAMVMLVPELYITLFQQNQGKPFAQFLEKWSPAVGTFMGKIFEKKWCCVVVQTVMFGILFVWYVTELDGAFYILAPVVGFV